MHLFIIICLLSGAGVFTQISALFPSALQSNIYSRPEDPEAVRKVFYPDGCLRMYPNAPFGHLMDVEAGPTDMAIKLLIKSADKVTGVRLSYHEVNNGDVADPAMKRTSAPVVNLTIPHTSEVEISHMFQLHEIMIEVKDVHQVEQLGIFKVYEVREKVSGKHGVNYMFSAYVRTEQVNSTMSTVPMTMGPIKCC